MRREQPAVLPMCAGGGRGGPNFVPRALRQAVYEIEVSPSTMRRGVNILSKKYSPLKLLLLAIVS